MNAELKSAREIITDFGGFRQMQLALGLKHLSVVQGWYARNKIPDWRTDAIKKAAKKKGINIYKETLLKQQEAV